jgi:gamma-glutamylaminecyclotransferase
MPRVFVYGSLQRGELNHRMLSGAHFVARVRTAAAFDLFDLGAFPAMAPHGRTSIAGELYEVSDALLERLDKFEGCPTLYQRETIALKDGTNAEAYVMPRQRLGRAPHVKAGCWQTWCQRSASQRGRSR